MSHAGLNADSSFGRWLHHVEANLNINVETVSELTRWVCDGGRLDDPKYPPTTVRFVAEGKDGVPLAGERPIIVCNAAVHSNMIGMCTLVDGIPHFLGMAKSEAGLIHRRYYPMQNDPYKNLWAVTCAHQFTPRPTNPFAWLPDKKECQRRGYTVLGFGPVFADPGMLAKVYNLGLVYVPRESAQAVAEEAIDMGWQCRWLMGLEMARLQEMGRATEFLFTTAGILAGRTIQEAVEAAW